MPRQSTTAKVTWRSLELLMTYMLQHRCGVIVRVKGEEYGLTADDLIIDPRDPNGTKIVGISSECEIPGRPSGWTIRKATLLVVKHDAGLYVPANPQIVESVEISNWIDQSASRFYDPAESRSEILEDLKSYCVSLGPDGIDLFDSLTLN